MAKYGNTSASSLVNTAAAAFKKNQALNDSIQSYTYSMSARTQDDLKAYHQYLDGRIAETQDPAQKLDFQKQKDSAFRNYVTAEIGRKSIDTLEGSGTDQNKYDTIVSLFRTAQQNGDDYLAQTLLQRADQLSIKMQQDAAAAAKAAKGGGGGSSNGPTNELLRRLQTGQNAIDTSLKTGRPLKDPVTGAVPKVKVDGKGDPILDANGHAQEDPNGKPLKVTANNYALMTGQAMKTQEQILVNAINTGGDENGTLMEKLTNLQKSKQFNDYTNPNLINLVTSGFKPFEVKVDSATGDRTVEPRKVLGVDPMLDKNGKPVLDENGQPVIGHVTYETGVAGGNGQAHTAGLYTYERKAGTSPTDPSETFGTTLYHNDPSGVAYTIDPVTGRKLYVRQETNAKGANVLSLTPKDEPLPSSSTLDTYKGAFADSTVGSALLGAGKGLASLLSGAAGAARANAGTLTGDYIGAAPGGGILNSILGAARNAFTNNTVQDQQRQAAEAANIARANAASAAALAAIPRAQANVPVSVQGNQVVGAKANVYAVPKATIKAQYTPGTSVFKPAQSGGSSYQQILQKVGL